MKKTYRIVAQCDPYHSRWQYNGNVVLRYEDGKPVEWLMKKGLSPKEAHKELQRLAKWDANINPERTYENDESIDAMRTMFPNASGISNDFSWYKGPGIYENGRAIVLDSDTSFQEDCVKYLIEEE